MIYLINVITVALCVSFDIILLISVGINWKYLIKVNDNVWRTNEWLFIESDKISVFARINKKLCNLNFWLNTVSLPWYYRTVNSIDDSVEHIELRSCKCCNDYEYIIKFDASSRNSIWRHSSQKYVHNMYLRVCKISIAKSRILISSNILGYILQFFQSPLLFARAAMDYLSKS